MKVEVWESKDSTTVVVEDNINKNNIIDEDSILIRTIEGSDWDDCMIQHFKIMNWEPYKPF